MASEGLSTDVNVAAAIELSIPERTGQYEFLSGQDRAQQIALDALEERLYATDRAEQLQESQDTEEI